MNISSNDLKNSSKDNSTQILHKNIQEQSEQLKQIHLQNQAQNTDIYEHLGSYKTSEDAITAHKTQSKDNIKLTNHQMN